MATRNPGPARPILVATMAAAALVASARPSTAQTQSVDPYKPYNLQYEPFVYPSLNVNPALPGQARLQYERNFGMPGVRGANQFSEVIGSTDPFGTGGPVTGPSARYDDSFRRYDREFGRVYRPNEKADRDFYSRQQERTDRYLAALREKDPRKRAQLIREIDREAILDARRANASPGSRTAPARAAAPATRTPATRGTAPIPAPGSPAAITAPAPPAAAPSASPARSEPDEILERSRRLGAQEPAAEPAATPEASPAGPPSAAEAPR